MNLEDILTSLIETLTTLILQEPKDLLEAANKILYPLKESGEIFNYYFSMREKDGEILLTIFLQKEESSSVESWELGISKGN
jgi:hypothetical protein